MKAVPSPIVPILQEWFAVGPSSARLAEALWLAGGQNRSVAELSAVTGQTAAGVYASLAKLGEAMDRGNLQHRRGDGGGWWLTPGGRAEIERAIADARARGVLS